MTTDLQELKTKFLNHEIILVDVREEDEWRECHIRGALFLPLSHLHDATLLSRLERDKVYYFYCASGTRANIVKKLFDPYFHNCYTVCASFTELKEAGFPVMREA